MFIYMYNNIVKSRTEFFQVRLTQVKFIKSADIFPHVQLGFGFFALGYIKI